ncbi:hypothetical protein V1T76_06490 [Roseibium sp. FZY0029]|nr:hypothetical protein [Roseibium sp. FZY0029]
MLVASRSHFRDFAANTHDLAIKPSLCSGWPFGRSIALPDFSNISGEREIPYPLATAGQTQRCRYGELRARRAAAMLRIYKPTFNETITSLDLKSALTHSIFDIVGLLVTFVVCS